eukprot:TRINITY_DN18338_c0_g1_i1.p1 TRINITY_DN18338_c0_g1~~TRINITY_DN18338_c0_g1_i1.p1  ORF type:complete len:911 (+),score=107.42 TRINITY_DN18338_c0_g1_i1:278-2734(+)
MIHVGPGQQKIPWEPPLPIDWMEVRDPESEYVHYQTLDNKQKRWRRPRATPRAVLPEGWQYRTEDVAWTFQNPSTYQWETHVVRWEIYSKCMRFDAKHACVDMREQLEKPGVEAPANSNIKLKVLDLSGNSLTDEGAKSLEMLLPHLKALKLSEAQIGNEGFEALATALNGCTRTSGCELERLELGGNAGVVADKLVTKVTKRLVDRKENKFFGNLWETFWFRDSLSPLTFLQRTRISRLDLAYTDLGPKFAIQLLKALKPSDWFTPGQPVDIALRMLDLSNNARLNDYVSRYNHRDELSDLIQNAGNDALRIDLSCAWCSTFKNHYRSRHSQSVDKLICSDGGPVHNDTRPTSNDAGQKMQARKTPSEVETLFKTRWEASTARLDLSGNVLDVKALGTLVKKPYNTLISLDLSECMITDDILMKELIPKVLRKDQLPNLQSLSLIGNQIKIPGAKALADHVSGALHLQELRLGKQQQQLAKIAEVDTLRGDEYLFDLDYVNNVVEETSSMVDAFTKLMQHSTLRVLDLSGFKVGNDGARKFVTALKSASSKLQVLVLADNNINQNGVGVFVDLSLLPADWQRAWDGTYQRYFYFYAPTGTSQWERPGITSLDLSGNPLHDEGTKKLQELLPAFKEVKLNRVSLGTEGLRILGTTLERCTHATGCHLESLELGGNFITRASLFEAWGQALNRPNIVGFLRSSILSRLDLGSNHLDLVAAIGLLSALKNTDAKGQRVDFALKTLVLSDNEELENEMRLESTTSLISHIYDFCNRLAEAGNDDFKVDLRCGRDRCNCNNLLNYPSCRQNWRKIECTPANT